MPYFLILPAFVLYLMGMGTVLAVTRVHPPAARFGPYVKSVLIWSSIGFVVTTVLYLGVMMAALGAIPRLTGDGPSALGGIAMAGFVFVGPFAAAIAGVFGGAVIGLRKVRGRFVSQQER
jgi:hypothetical protein